jgi:hypothetical protein
MAGWVAIRNRIIAFVKEGAPNTRISARTIASVCQCSTATVADVMKGLGEQGLVQYMPDVTYKLLPALFRKVEVAQQVQQPRAKHPADTKIERLLAYIKVLGPDDFPLNRNKAASHIHSTYAAVSVMIVQLTDQKRLFKYEIPGFYGVHETPPDFMLALVEAKRAHTHMIQERDERIRQQVEERRIQREAKGQVRRQAEELKRRQKAARLVELAARHMPTVAPVVFQPPRKTIALPQPKPAVQDPWAILRARANQRPTMPTEPGIVRPLTDAQKMGRNSYVRPR